MKEDHRSYLTQLLQLRKEIRKKFKLVRDSYPWPLRYRCSVLPNERFNGLLPFGLLAQLVARALHRYRRGQGRHGLLAATPYNTYEIQHRSGLNQQSESSYFFIKFVTFTRDQFNFTEFPQQFLTVLSSPALEGIFHIIIMVKIVQPYWLLTTISETNVKAINIIRLMNLNNYCINTN